MSDLIKLTQIGIFDTGLFDEDAAEINAYDPDSQRLFVINGATDSINVLDLSDPTEPTALLNIDLTDFGAGVNSVAVKNGLVVAAIENDNSQEPGQVVFFNSNGDFLKAVTVGALPDMVTFTPNGDKLLVANEGEPNDEVDPNGSISIIDLTAGVNNATVSTADFTRFNGQEEELRSRGVRIFPDRSFAEDAEPEYISVSPDGSTAFVTLQENNAVAVVDIAAGEVTEIQPLGVKDFSKGLP